MELHIKLMPINFGIVYIKLRKDIHVQMLAMYSQKQV